MLADYQAHLLNVTKSMMSRNGSLPSERFETKVTFQPEKDASE
jgi:hypothetical protein